MPQYIRVPPQRLATDILQALMEEYVTRDGTDYGAVELTLEQKVARLEGQITRGDIWLLYDGDSEEWDLLPREEAALLTDS